MSINESSEQPLYLQLNDLHAKSRQDYLNYNIAAQRFVSHFSNKIFEAMGYPERTFTHDSTEVPWVKVYELSEDNSVKQSLPSQLSSWDENGHLRFAIGITLSKALNTFPKESLWVGYSVKPMENSVRLQELVSQKTYEITDLESYTPPVKAFFENVTDALRRRPAETFQERRGIGFM